MAQQITGSGADLRRALAYGWGQRCSDSVDRRLLSQNLEYWDSGIDFCDAIDEVRVQEAASRLDLPLHEIRRRYEALAHQFPLKLAWQEATESPAV